METITSIIGEINGIVWGWPMLGPDPWGRTVHEHWPETDADFEADNWF